MLMRRTPMNPGKGFGSGGHGAGPQDRDREARLQERAERQIASALATAGMGCSRSVVVMGPASTGIAIGKENAVSYEPYRRLVAELPCMWCGVSGYSQHAHLNRGKGMGLKTDDRTGFPLCCSRPGIEGCHVAYDQYRLLESGGREAHREYGIEAGRFTRDQILKAGLWPKKVPLWARAA